MVSPGVHRRGVHPALRVVTYGVGHAPLKLRLRHLIPLGLHDLLSLDREGIELVVLGEGTLVSGDPRQLEEQLIPLMVFDAVALRACPDPFARGLIAHEPVGLDDRFEGVADAAFLLGVVMSPENSPRRRRGRGERPARGNSQMMPICTAR